MVLTVDRLLLKTWVGRTLRMSDLEEKTPFVIGSPSGRRTAFRYPLDSGRGSVNSESDCWWVDVAETTLDSHPTTVEDTVVLCKRSALEEVIHTVGKIGHLSGSMMATINKQAIKRRGMFPIESERFSSLISKLCNVQDHDYSRAEYIYVGNNFSPVTRTNGR